MAMTVYKFKYPPKLCFPTLVVGILLYAAQSVAGKKAGEVLVTTGTDSAPSRDASDTGKAGTKRQDAFRDRIRKDGLNASNILRKTVCGGAPLSVWAAVYLRRLGISHDTACAARALVDGAQAADPLLQTLAWRHLASDRTIPLPKWEGDMGRDPAVRAIAAIAYAIRGDVPPSLKFALMIPAGTPSGKSRRQAVEKRTGHLGALGLPFDDGPVAIAVSFAEAREQECVVGVGKRRQFAAEPLRKALLAALVDEPATVAAKLPLRTSKPPDLETLPRGAGDVGDRLDNPLVSRPIETLRAIVLTGAMSLRRDALRAVAIIAKEPATGDLAAAASALSVTDPVVRVEGARTFLLLIKRAR